MWRACQTGRMTRSTPRGASAAAAVLSALAAMAFLVLVVSLVLAFGPDSRPEGRTPDGDGESSAAGWERGLFRSRAPEPTAVPPLSAHSYSAPFLGPVTSCFGPRANPFGEGSVPPGATDEDRLTDHRGVDLGRVPEGTPFRAVSDGVVAGVDLGGEAGGNVILVDEPGGRQWLYAHARTGSAVVEEGQRVSAGDVLAEVGETGTATAPHLHLELRVDGEPRDPAPFLAARGVVLGDGWRAPRGC